MRLSDADLRAVLAATITLTANPAPDFTDVLTQLRSLVPSQSVSFNDLTLATGDFRYSIVPPDVVDLAVRLKPAFDRFMYQHPLVNHVFTHAGCGAIRFGDLPDPDSVLTTDLYREFYEPFGIRFQMVIQLASPPDVVVGYAFNRTPAQGEFSDRDVEVVNALEGHLLMHHRITMDRERSDVLETEADRHGWTVVTVRSDGVIEESSSQDLAPDLASGRLVPPNVAALLASRESGPWDDTTHDLDVDGDRWRCVVRPVPVGPTVLLIRRITDEPPRSTRLTDLGLTRRQAEVALKLADTGATNSQLARSMKLSEGTVKKHLETVYRVLQVDSRAAAVVALRSLSA